MGATNVICSTTAPVAEDNTNGFISVSEKPTATSTNTWSVHQFTALAASAVIKSSSGKLHTWCGRIDSTAPTGTYYVEFLNASSLPADGAVTTLVTPIKVQHVNGVDDVINTDVMDVHASSGIVVCLSSTDFATKTISGAYLSGTGQYK